MTLEGKVVIVTGAGRGLGREISVGFAEAGADLVLAARTLEQLEVTADRVRKAGKKALIVPTNVSDEEQVNSMVEKTIEEYGRIDVMLNNAGITSPDSFLDISRKRWDLIIGVNLEGTFLCTKASLPKMLEQGSGMIINVSSILAKEVRFSVAYGVTKAGLERFTLGLAREMRKNAGMKGLPSAWHGRCGKMPVLLLPASDPTLLPPKQLPASLRVKTRVVGKPPTCGLNTFR